MVWAPLDLKVVTCGLEGAVYEWDVATGQRIGEVITKSCSCSDICVSTDGKITYSVGSDGYIKEITASQVRAELFLSHSFVPNIYFKQYINFPRNLMFFCVS